MCGPRQLFFHRGAEMPKVGHPSEDLRQAVKGGVVTLICQMGTLPISMGERLQSTQSRQMMSELRFKSGSVQLWKRGLFKSHRVLFHSFLAPLEAELPRLLYSLSSNFHCHLWQKTETLDCLGLAPDSTSFGA